MEASLDKQIYASAFAKMDHFIYILDKNGILIDCNHNLLHFLGLTRIEQHSIDAIYNMMRQQGLWTSEQIQQFKQHDIDCILSGKSQTEQQAIINTHGLILYFECTRQPLFNPSNELIGLAVTLRDLTKQKQIARQLKESKLQLRKGQVLNQHSPSTVPSKIPQNNFKILLIEDNPLVQKAEKNILMSCRCITDVAATPKQANEIFTPGKYDLVLMDLTLQEGDGYQLTAILRQKEKGSPVRVPIIALTGHDPDIVGFNCEDAEMDGILRKPLTVEQAQQLIQRYIRHANVHVKGLQQFKQ